MNVTTIFFLFFFSRMQRHNLFLVMLPFTIPFLSYVCELIRCPCRPIKQADPSTSKKKLRESLCESKTSSRRHWNKQRREKRIEARQSDSLTIKYLSHHFFSFFRSDRSETSQKNIYIFRRYFHQFFCQNSIRFRE